MRFQRLQKQLSLFDVYVVSTGAMVSSGFFLLPGLAASHAGPGVVLAYLVGGFLIVPAMLSQAELATAMPRAGGAYYFLDRTLGPLVGTIGGVGTWLALVLKSAFALIGMGAYTTFLLEPAGVHLPVVPTAVGFTVLFAALNVAGAKESSVLLRLLVIGLLVVLILFVVHGLIDVAQSGFAATHRRQFSPFMPQGLDGLLATVGLIFVSYIGLTKVASLAEEIVDPERNIPLGMGLALLTVMAIYVLGVYVMVAVLGSDALSGSLTPVADAAAEFTEWLPGRAGLWVMVAAAVAAFASMANAGILAASRYPLAMARDHLLPGGLATTGRRGTPVAAILLTGGVMVAFLVVLDVEAVAKLASSLQLLLFALINVAVIVMRESHIESYDPGFKSPLYPWVQLIGLFVPFVLVAEMGWLPVLFTLGVTTVSFAWYYYYARHRIERDGAIYHVFERLGRRRFAGLDRELRDIMKEKGARAQDPFDQVVARAIVMDLPRPARLGSVMRDASRRLAARLPTTDAHLEVAFHRVVDAGGTPVARGVALLHTRLPELEGSELALVRCRDGIEIDVSDDMVREAGDTPIRAIFFLVSGEHDPGQHLRILAQLAARSEDETFLQRWLRDRDEQELKETLLRDDRFLSLSVRAGTKSDVLIGRPLQDLDMPEGALIALIHRRGQTIVPRGRTVINDGDRLTILGDPAQLQELASRYGEK